MLSDAGVNWSDLDVLSDVGINWGDLSVMSTSGVNWVDVSQSRYFGWCELAGCGCVE